MSQRQRASRALTLVIAFAAVSCSSSEQTPTPDLAERVQADTGLRPVRASCVAHYADQYFTDDEVADLAEQGLAGLPRNLWETYQRVVTASAFGDRQELPAGDEVD